MYYDILDKKRLTILPTLKPLKADFYLAGGTALALQLGHRDSIDFDFFCFDSFDTASLYERLRIIFSSHKILKTQEEKNTLGLLVDGVKMSFMTYQYKPLKMPINEEFLKLASLEDIACMKLSAVLSRSTNKDYIDLFFIAQEIGYKKMLGLFEKKHKDIDINLVRKSLVYFDDILDEPIMFKHRKEIPFIKIRDFFIKNAKESLD